MPCQKLTPKCSSVNDCCLDHIKDTILYTTKLFEELKISYWVDYNTLKGAIEGAVYADKNVVSVDELSLDKIKALGHRIYEDGYFLTVGRFENSFQLSYSRSNLMSIDIIGWDLRRHTVRRKPIHGSSCNFPKKLIETLDEIDLAGYKVKCPNNPAEFIKLRGL